MESQVEEPSELDRALAKLVKKAAEKRRDSTAAITKKKTAELQTESDAALAALNKESSAALTQIKNAAALELKTISDAQARAASLVAAANKQISASTKEIDALILEFEAAVENASSLIRSSGKAAGAARIEAAKEIVERSTSDLDGALARIADVTTVKRDKLVSKFSRAVGQCE